MTREKHREYEAAYRAKDRKRYNHIKTAERRRLKEQVISHYGGKCACCGETEPLFLQIDHIEGNGKQHLRDNGIRGAGDKTYRWLRKNGYPPGFQVLCANCNIGRYINGGVCPHESTREGEGETVGV